LAASLVSAAGFSAGFACGFLGAWLHDLMTSGLKLLKVAYQKKKLGYLLTEGASKQMVFYILNKYLRTF